MTGIGALSCRDEEESPDAVDPVQEVAGLTDEDPLQLPAVLHPLRQAQRVQEAHGELHHTYAPE